MEKVLKYTENEVNFDSVKIPQILYEHGPLGRKGKIEYNDDEVTHIDSKPFINAVDIDWNGIEIENNNRINTTADLINWIKSRSTGSSGGSQTETISVPITCYRWYHIDAEPHIPTENSKEPKSTDSFDAIPESKWSKYAPNRPEGNDWVLYLCSGTKEGKSYLWESVTRISGIDGSVGEDSKDREWIYKVFNEEQTFSFDNYNPNNWDAVQQDDYVGPNGWQWFDNPQGVSKENRFEYASYRDYKNKQWTKFSTPILWSHYGVNGIDGDGVEYCYVRTVSKEAPEVVVNNIENELTDEYKPLVKIESLAGYNNTKQDIKGEGEYYQNDGYSYTRCTDDPKGVDGTFQYEWVIVRKKDEPNDNGTRKWKRYSGQMSLWSSFTVNIDHAITIKDGFLWGDGDYIRDGDGNPIQIEGGDGSQGVETIGCPDENKTYKPGTISVCENKVKIYHNDQWIDFGEGSGSGKYIHVAYAKTIDFVNKKYTGFSTTNSNDGTIYDWMGIMFDDKIDDTNIDSDNTNDLDGILWDTFKQYKWNYIKGRDGNGVEYVFLLTKEEVTNPGIDENTYVDNEGVSHNKQADEFLPKVKDYNTYYQSEYWTDDPQQGVSAKWPKLWKAIRKKVNGVWQSFGEPKIENQLSIDGYFYRLVIQNDSQSYKSDGTPNNNSNPIISVHKIKDGKSEQITENIKLINDTINLSEGSGITLVIPNGLKGTYVDGNSTVSIDYSNPNKLPITLENVDYKQGGYDIALYYDKELLDAEHIDCVKDGKDASISDGITIQSITRYYQATNTNNTYPDPYTTNSDGWHDKQSDTDWSASKPYLYIQDKTTYNNKSYSWGPVELYSYWGNENYDLVVSPQHIILDEKVNEKNEDRSYLGTNTVTVTLYKSGKSGTENSITPTIPQCKFYFIKDSNPYNLTQIERNINTKTTTITINTNKSNGSSMYSIEEYLSDKDNSISEGYLSFTVEGCENSKLIFTREVKVPVYINRVESTLFKVKGELENFVASETQGIVNGLDETYVQKKTYSTDIEATEKKLRSEYTEIIKRVGDYNPNLFGFHKDIEFGRFVPFIQGYGIAIPESLWIKDNGEYYGYIKNLGFDGVGGLFTISFKARTFQSNTSQSNTSQSNNVEFIFWTNKECSNTNTVNINDSWKECTLEYNLDLDVTGVTDTNAKNSIPEGELQIRTSNNNFDLYIRELKIERGNIKTLFCEAEEDLSYFDDKQLISNLSFNSDYISYSSDTEVENKTGVYYTSNDIIANNLTNDFVDLLYQNNSFNIEAGCVYTLSYWAKFSNPNEVYITSYLQDSANNLIQDIANNIYIPGNSGSIIAGVKSNGETFVRLSNEWKHYFIRFYATNSINNANLIVARYFKKKFNSNVYLNGSGQLYIYDIKFQEGYAVESNYYGSLVEQTARGISLFQQTGLKKTGIDISTGNITVQADQFTIINSSGQENMSVNETGDVEFRGVIKGTYGYNIQMYNPHPTLTTDNYIKSDTDYYLFGQKGMSSSKYTLYLPEASMCPGRRIEIVNSFLASDASYVQLCALPYDNNLQLYAPIAAFTNEETMTTRYDIGDVRKIIVWADPSLISKGSGQGWRILEVDKHLGYDYLISDEATSALTYNLNKPEVINALVSVLKNKL